MSSVRRPVIPGLLRSAAPQGSERKALVVSQSTAAPGGAALALNATGSILAINEVATGSSFFNRIGRKISMKSLRLQAIIKPMNVTRAALNDWARLLVVYDRQTNGALPSISDVIQDTEQNGTNTTNVESGINLNNRDRFMVIIDKKVMIPAATDTASVLTNTWPNSHGAATVDAKGLAIDEYRKLPNLVTQYKADSNPAVIGDISTGSLLLITLADTVAGAEIFQVAGWNTRLRFED